MNAREYFGVLADLYWGTPADASAQQISRAMAALGAKAGVDAAERLGVEPGIWRKWVHRGEIPLRRLRDISEKTGHSLDWLVTGECSANDRLLDMHPERIKAELRMRGTNCARIASKLDLSRTTVSAVVHGRVQSARVADAIAHVLGSDRATLWPSVYTRKKKQRRAA